jgi:hypothetical protein
MSYKINKTYSKNILKAKDKIKHIEDTSLKKAYTVAQDILIKDMSSNFSKLMKKEKTIKKVTFLFGSFYNDEGYNKELKSLDLAIDNKNINIPLYDREPDFYDGDNLSDNIKKEIIKITEYLYSLEDDINKYFQIIESDNCEFELEFSLVSN